MNDVQGSLQTIERLEQLVADLAVTDSGLQERSSEIKSDHAALSKVAADIRADITALHNADTLKERQLREEQKLATTKESATNIQELAKRLKAANANEVRDGLRGLWRLTLGLAAGIVLLLGWMYLRDPISSRLKQLEQEAREQERMAVLAPNIKPDGKGGWTVRISTPQQPPGRRGSEVRRSHCWV